MTEQYARPTTYGPWIRPLLRTHAQDLGDEGNAILVELSSRAREGQLIVLDIPSPARGYAVIREDEPTLQINIESWETAEVYPALFGAIADLGNYAVQHVVPARLATPQIRDAIREHGAKFGIYLDDDREAVEEVTVTLDFDDDRVDVFHTIGKGETIDRPEDPTREGFEFNGWWIYDDKGSASHHDFSAPVEVDTRIVADWTPITPEAVDKSEESVEKSPEDDAPVEEDGPETEPDEELDDDDEEDDAVPEITEEDIAAAVKESRYGKMKREPLEAIAKDRSIFIPKKIDDLRRALFESDGDSEPFED